MSQGILFIKDIYDITVYVSPIVVLISYVCLPFLYKRNKCPSFPEYTMYIKDPEGGNEQAALLFGLNRGKNTQHPPICVVHSVQWR